MGLRRSDLGSGFTPGFAGGRALATEVEGRGFIALKVLGSGFTPGFAGGRALATEVEGRGFIALKV